MKRAIYLALIVVMLMVEPASAAGESKKIFLPFTANRFITPGSYELIYFDDFSDPGSGWSVRAGAFDYFSGEYQMIVEPLVILMLPAPIDPFHHR